MISTMSKQTRKLSDAGMNVSRRKKYASDPLYKRIVLERSAAFRAQQAHKSVVTVMDNEYNRRVLLSINNGQFMRYARERRLENTSKPVLCFTPMEIAGVLERGEVVYSWIQKRYVLPPDLSVKASNGPAFAAYSVALARRILLAVISVINGPTGQLRKKHLTYLRQKLKMK